MKKISVIVSCYNEEEALPLFYKEMEQVRKKDFKDVDFEYIFVNDGSKDKTFRRRLYNTNGCRFARSTSLIKKNV